MPQAAFGFTGLFVTAIYALTTQTPHAEVSKGFAIPVGNMTLITPGYTGSLDCVDPKTGASTCDNYAYPTGDMAVNPHGMTDPDAYAPFPNALVFNWASLIVLSVGNLCALDFQQRCMASRTPGIARLGCILAGIILFTVALPFGAIGGERVWALASEAQCKVRAHAAPAAGQRRDGDARTALELTPWLLTASPLLPDPRPGAPLLWARLAVRRVHRRHL